MAVDREGILGALFARLQTVADFPTTGRRVLFWSEVSEQPALFLRHVMDHYPPRASGIPAHVTMRAEVWIYSQAGKNPDAVPEAALNQLVSAVETVLAPEAIWNGRNIQNVQTLGRLDVEHCWIEGDIIFDNGDLDAQGKVIVPIAILVPQ